MHYIISLTTRSSRASRRNENGNEFACEELVSLLRGSSRLGRWQPLHCFRIDESLSVCSQFTKPNLPEISREKPWIMSCCSSNNIGARGFEIDLLHRVVIHSAQWVILPLFCSATRKNLIVDTFAAVWIFARSREPRGFVVCWHPMSTKLVDDRWRFLWGAAKLFFLNYRLEIFSKRRRLAK